MCSFLQDPILYPLQTAHYGTGFKGSGQYSIVLTLTEEADLLQHVKWRASIGCGVDWIQLQLLIQEVLLAVTTSNPERVTGYEKSGQLPNMSYVRRLSEKYNLSLRRTAEISKGRQILTEADLRLWQKDTVDYLWSKPELAEALQDPSRIFNQDETSVQIGSSCKRILAEVGTKVLMSISSGRREHITASYLVYASGGMVPPRCVFRGVRNVALVHLKNLPTDGKSGAWQHSVAPKGYMTREVFLDVLKDLDKYTEEEKIKRPILLFLDGAGGPHISIEAGRFCKDKKIQPWLLRPNMTHVTQPLDLSFFSPLKNELKKLVWNWQSDPSHAGQTLNKYSIVTVLQEATEKILENPDIIKNGFKNSGIYPWNPNSPNLTKLVPGSIFASSTYCPTMEEVTPNYLTHNVEATEDSLNNDDC